MLSKKIKVAIVCDWLTNMGGAEKVIHGLHHLFPNAPIYTSIYNPEKVIGFEKADIRTSYLQKYPFAKVKHQLYLPFLPKVFESFDFDDYDLVISSSHSCAKGIITRPETLHICYCHSPMRYAWEDSINYINEYEVNSLLKKIAGLYIHNIRLWDRLSADRVDYYIANSETVKNRIIKYYRKNATVIHPFVDIENFSLIRNRKDFFLAVGRLIPYKRFDLLIEAFNKTGLNLVIAGTGIMEEKLKKMASPNIEFLGYVDDKKLKELYCTAKGVIFPQVEDFGIVPIEAMASGCPVIAYGKGGALDTITDGISGTFFHEQTPESIIKSINTFNRIEFDSTKIRNQANLFSKDVFNKKIIEFIEKKLYIWQKEMI